MMKIQAIIPARFNSTRLPGKPLFVIKGKTLVEHVYIRATTLFDSVLVATDDLRIKREVERFGGKCVMTSNQHKSGTDRCAEAASPDYDVILNIQCDVPFIPINDLEKFIYAFANDSIDISTLVYLENLNNVNAILKDNFAVNFSRYNYKHIGVYGFRYKTLMELTKLQQTENEKQHSLEQLRWLDNGYKIHAIITNTHTKSIDTYEDYYRVLADSWKLRD